MLHLFPFAHVGRVNSSTRLTQDCNRLLTSPFGWRGQQTHPLQAQTGSDATSSSLITAGPPLLRLRLICYRSHFSRAGRVATKSPIRKPLASALPYIIRSPLPYLYYWMSYISSKMVNYIFKSYKGVAESPELV